MNRESQIVFESSAGASVSAVKGLTSMLFVASAVILACFILIGLISKIRRGEFDVILSTVVEMMAVTLILGLVVYIVS